MKILPALLTMACSLMTAVTVKSAEDSGGATRASTQAHSASTNVNLLLQPTKSPLVTFRILFLTGSAYDPVGKEGLASLTAALIAEGGSQRSLGWVCLVSVELT